LAMQNSGLFARAAREAGEPSKAKLLIVDGHCYAYRAFFAIRSLTSPSGTATNAIYGFIRMLAKVQALIQPSHVLVVWDGGLARERMILLPEYKAQRAEMPSDLEAQLDQIVHYLHASNITSYVQDGCEADDCIASITERAVAAGWEVVIATSDKDFMQLVSPHVWLLNPHDKTETLVGVEQVKSKTGVEPTQIVDWLSLIGDAVDNIPGAPGVGPKTATDLLRQFGSVDALYQRLGEVRSERLRASLEKSADAVRRNQQLVKLKLEAPCAVALEELALKAADVGGLRALFSNWGFKKLLQELEEAHLGASDFFAEKEEVA
jgi:DNA polymerase-1